MAMRVVGEGTPLVFVHGGLSTVDDYGGLLDALGRRCRVAALSRRGYGGTDEGSYSYDREADDVVAAAGTIGASAVLGHSSGAIVALRAAARGPFAKVVLYEPPLPVDGPVLGEEVTRAAEAAVARGDYAEAITIGLRDGVKLPADVLAVVRTLPSWEQQCALAPAWVREFPEIDGSTDLSWCPSVDADVLLLWGDQTQQHHRRAVERLAELLPRATVRRLDGVGHEAPMFVPEVVAAAVHEFVSEPPQAK